MEIKFEFSFFYSYKRPGISCLYNIIFLLQIYLKDRYGVFSFSSTSSAPISTKFHQDSQKKGISWFITWEFLSPSCE